MTANELRDNMIYNLDENDELAIALSKTNFVFLDTGVFTKIDWNTYWRYLRIECEKELYDYFEKNKKYIFELADKVHGKQNDYYLKDVEFVKTKLNLQNIENEKIIYINDTIEIDKETQLIGQGGFSSVYKVKDFLINDITYAYKILDPSSFNKSSYEVDFNRFVREAKFLFSFSHENIVKIYSIGSIKPKGTYIKMEYIDGWKLKDYITNNGPLSAEIKQKLAEQIISAIGYSHSKGVLHRDLAERNIMVNKEGNIKILDFGLAKIPGENTDLTTLSTIINTDYIAPEVKEDYTKYSIQSDIYSIGCILFRIFTNRTINTDYVRILEENKVQQNIIKVISKCLSVSLEDRYKNCGELLADFEETKNKTDIIIKDYSLDNFKYLVEEGITEIAVAYNFRNEISIYQNMMDKKLDEIINSNKFVSSISIEQIARCIPHYNISHYENVKITLKELNELKEFYKNLSEEDKENFCKNIKNIFENKISIDTLPF